MPVSRSSRSVARMIRPTINWSTPTYVPTVDLRIHLPTTIYLLNIPATWHYFFSFFARRNRLLQFNARSVHHSVTAKPRRRRATTTVASQTRELCMNDPLASCAPLDVLTLGGGTGCPYLCTVEDGVYDGTHSLGQLSELEVDISYIEQQK